MVAAATVRAQLAERQALAGRGDNCGGRCCAPTALALLASGSRGETRCAGCARCARTIAASQKYEARCARRPRDCAARRRRHRPAQPAPAARATSTVFEAKTRTAPVAGAVRRNGRSCNDGVSRRTPQRCLQRRVPARGRRRACAQPRSAAVPAGARSAPRTSDSPRLSERSSRSERSEFRGAAGAASIAGHPRAAGASTGTPATGGPRAGTRLCPRKPSARGAPTSARCRTAPACTASRPAARSACRSSRRASPAAATPPRGTGRSPSCEARMRNSRGLNCRASRRISRRIS